MARDIARAQLPTGLPHDASGAHAQESSEARGVDAVARVHWAETIGPQTAASAGAILTERPHSEQGYRSCLGILRLAKRYGEVREGSRMRRAMVAGTRSYRHVESILKHGLDRALATPSSMSAQLPLTHGNVRGRGYYPVNAT